MFTACGGDDDGGVSASETPSPTITDKYGKKITVQSVGEYYFSYDKNGKLKSFGRGEREHYEIDGDKFVIKGGSDWSGEGFSDYEQTTANVSLNSHGFISGIEMNSKYEYEGEDEKEESHDKITLYFDYDENGQLIKMSGEVEGKSIESEYEGKQEYRYEMSYDGKYEQNIKWVNGKIVNSEIKASNTANMSGEKYKGESETSIDIDYEKTKNPVRQYSYFIAHEILGDISGDMSILEPLCHAGLFGKGTNMLPSGYTVESYEFNDFDDDSEYSKECELSFELNKNGTINYEERDYDEGVQFKYGRSASKEDAKATRSIAVEKKKKSPRGLIKRHRKTRK